MTAPRDLDPARALANPLWWCAVALLALNDHVLKGAGVLPEIVTGKLSDAAGLLVVPTLLAVLLRARSRTAVAICHGVPLVLLALLKLSPDVADGVVAGAAHLGETWSIVADPTDLLAAIPAALASWRWVARPAFVTARGEPALAPVVPSRRPLGPRQLVMVGLAALACGATSRSAPQAPAIDGGRVVAGPFGEAETYVIEPRSGRVLRKLEAWSGDPPTVFRGAMWSVRSDGRVGPRIVATDLESGRERMMPMPSGVDGSEIEGIDAESIYVRSHCAPDDCGGRGSRFHAIDLATGRVRWSSSSDSGAGVVVGEGIVATTEGPRLLVRDASGTILHSRTMFDRARALGLGSGVLWVGDARGTLLALSPRDGMVRGAWELGHAAGSMAPEMNIGAQRAAASGERLYLALDDRIVAVALGAARPLWERPGSRVAVTGEVTVIESDDGMLAGFDGASGRSIWVAATGGTWGGFAVGDGIVARREGDAFVGVFDARSGRLLSRFDLDEGRPAGPLSARAPAAAGALP